MSYAAFFSRLNVKGSRSQVLARCPFHEDQHASLSINTETGLWNCKAGSCGKKGNANEMANLMNWTKPDQSSQTDNRVFAKWVYQNEHGIPVYEILRMWPLEPKKFLIRRKVGDQWVYSREGVKTIPYNLPNVLKAKTVYLVEGEKDAETLISRGIVATCIPFGAGSWKTDYANWFKGKEVILIPDCDEAGEKFAVDVAKDLLVSLVRLESEKKGYDISDWFDDGHTLEEFHALRFKLDRDNKTIWEIDKQVIADIDKVYSQGENVKPTGVTSLEKLDYYTWGFQPETTYVVGARTSIGKSAFAVTCAVKAAERGFKVLYFAIESSARKIRQRILSQLSGIPLMQICRGPLYDTDRQKLVHALGRDLPIHINDKRDLSSVAIREYVKCRMKMHGVDLVIVDHLQEVKEEGKFWSRHHELSNAFSNLQSMAEGFKIPVMILTQLRRPSSLDDDKAPTVYELKESGDIEQKADTVILLHRKRDESDEVTVLVSKSRDAITGAFKLKWDGPRLTFLEEDNFYGTWIHETSRVERAVDRVVERVRGGGFLGYSAGDS